MGAEGKEAGVKRGLDGDVIEADMAIFEGVSPSNMVISSSITSPSNLLLTPASFPSAPMNQVLRSEDLNIETALKLTNLSVNMRKLGTSGPDLGSTPSPWSIDQPGAKIISKLEDTL